MLDKHTLNPCRTSNLRLLVLHTLTSRDQVVVVLANKLQLRNLLVWKCQTKTWISVLMMCIKHLANCITIHIATGVNTDLPLERCQSLHLSDLL